MGNYWTRKNDREDEDANVFTAWTEHVMKEDRDNIRNKDPEKDINVHTPA